MAVVTPEEWYRLFWVRWGLVALACVAIVNGLTVLAIRLWLFNPLIRAIEQWKR